MGRLLMKGGKKKKKRPGLGKVKTKQGKVKTKQGKVKSKNKKKKKKNQKHRQNEYTIRQPRKKKMSFHIPRLKQPLQTMRKSNKLSRKPERHVQSFSMIDSSSYSNIMGQEDYKRKMGQHRYDDGRESGIIYDQDNDKIIIERYP